MWVWRKIKYFAALLLCGGFALSWINECGQWSLPVSILLIIWSSSLQKCVYLYSCFIPRQTNLIFHLGIFEEKMSISFIRFLANLEDRKSFMCIIVTSFCPHFWSFDFTMPVSFTSGFMNCEYILTCSILSCRFFTWRKFYSCTFCSF